MRRRLAAGAALGQLWTRRRQRQRGWQLQQRVGRQTTLEVPPRHCEWPLAAWLLLQRRQLLQQRQWLLWLRGRWGVVEPLVLLLLVLLDWPAGAAVALLQRAKPQQQQKQLLQLQRLQLM